MKATIVDLRYRMSDVLRALERNEDVDILYHGKTKGVIRSCRARKGGKVSGHPFFGMRKSKTAVAAQMEKLRGGRYRAL
jgi:antitoxin (DNA-binding transcriptional repressor) of toxin-antitoxin stability system